MHYTTGGKCIPDKTDRIFTLEYGKGKMQICLDNFFPCKVSELNKLMAIMGMTKEPEAKAQELQAYIKYAITETKKGKERKKRFVELSARIEKRFGVASAVETPEQIRFKKTTVLAIIHNADKGRGEIKEISGFKFDYLGSTFTTYKKTYSPKCSKWIILLPSTGLGIGLTAEKKNEIRETLEKQLPALARCLGNQIEAAEKQFNDLLEECENKEFWLETLPELASVAPIKVEDEAKQEVKQDHPQTDVKETKPKRQTRKASRKPEKKLKTAAERTAHLPKHAVNADLATDAPDMTKTTAIVIGKNGKLETHAGQRFEYLGNVFVAYRNKQTHRWHIVAPSTGLDIATWIENRRLLIPALNEKLGEVGADIASGAFGEKEKAFAKLLQATPELAEIAASLPECKPINKPIERQENKHFALAIYKPMFTDFKQVA